MSDKFDRDGNPLDLMGWAALIEDQNYKRVAFSQVGAVEVSTVWLGLNHNFGSGPPLIFETMIFGGEHDSYQDRYSTEAEALAGHDRIVAVLRDGGAP
jgi:hypothetical protein